MPKTLTDNLILTSFSERELAAMADLCRAAGSHDLLLAKIERYLHADDISGGRVVGHGSFVINETDGDHKPRLVRVEQESQGIAVHIPGYGDQGTVAGHGVPVLVEFRDGEPHVIVWDDINEEEPSHVISLAGAAEDKRKPDPE